MHGMDGWDWAWMAFTMIFWLLAFAVAVYVIVKVASRPPADRR